MKRVFAGLNRRQVVTLAVLLLADVALLLGGFWVVRGATPAGAATAVPSVSCQAFGAQLLAWRNLAGTVRLDSDGVLRFELTGLDTSGKPLPRASETAWDAMASALALPEGGCGPYRLLRVDVPDPDEQPGRRMLVEVSWIDLRAWGRGELDDGELAARLKATTYVRPEIIRP